MAEPPSFSVIITTHNRPRLVAACVESVLAQTFPADRVELVVVDDGSRPATARVLARYVSTGRVDYLWQPQQGWGVARLVGVRRSQGEIAAFLDDDCAAPPGWLACYAAGYAAHPDADGIGGGLRPGPRLNVAGCKQYAGHLAYFDRMNAPLGTRVDQPGRAWFTFGGNRTFRRAVWLAAQPDTWSWYHDDTLIDVRLRAIGARIYYDPAAWVTHHYVLSVVQRVRMAYRYGRSEAHAGQELSHELGNLHEKRRLSLADRWRRLNVEVPEAAWTERAWYALTQPLTWIARRAGRLR